MRHEKASGAILVVGGGRWARTYLAVLAGLDLPFAKIITLSRHGGEQLAGVLAQANARQTATFALAQNLDEVLERESVIGAIVVNAARDHPGTALSLLRRNIPLLVEKPVALTRFESAQLNAAAQASGTLLMPGHVLNFCAYLENFSAAARQAQGPPQTIIIRWKDTPGEMRYGETKSFDPGLGVVEDVGPHIATILSSFLGGAAGPMEEPVVERGGLAVALRGSWNGTGVLISLERAAASRERLIVWRDQDGREARLDFAIEPGIMEIAGQARSGDPQWPRPQGPLALQLRSFLQNIGQPPNGKYLQSIDDTTKFVAGLAQQVRAAQQRLIARSGGDAQDRHVAIRELLAPLLMDAGLWRAGDKQALDALARDALAGMAAKSPRPSLVDLVEDIRPRA